MLNNPVNQRGPSPNFLWTETCVSDTARAKGLNNDWRDTEIDRLDEFYDRIRYTASVLEIVREIINQSIPVSSWYRSPQLNAIVPGHATNSAHMQGLAVDITPHGDLASLCGHIADGLDARGIDWDQIIFENTWIHIGVSTGLDAVNGCPVGLRKQRMSMHDGVYSFGFQ